MDTPVHHSKDWHQKHEEQKTVGQKIADFVASGMGSWTFIISQSIFVIIWIGFNLVAWFYHWDVYPFILLNLLFSTQAAYSAPIIMMSQNRQNERDRVHAAEDYKTNVQAKQEIEDLQKALARIENEKLNDIINRLDALQKK